MMRIIQIFLMLLFLSPLAMAQQPSMPSARNSIYLEVLGNGGLYSYNIERLLSEQFAVRIGYTRFTSSDLFGAGEKTILAFPLLGSFLLGKGNSKLEIGGGLLLGRGRTSSAFGEENNRSWTIFDLTGVAGYRYQRPGGGLLFRIGLTPFLPLTNGEDAYPDSGFFLSGGMSIGVTF